MSAASASAAVVARVCVLIVSWAAQGNPQDCSAHYCPDGNGTVHECCLLERLRESLEKFENESAERRSEALAEKEKAEKAEKKAEALEAKFKQIAHDEEVKENQSRNLNCESNERLRDACAARNRVRHAWREVADANASLIEIQKRVKEQNSRKEALVKKVEESNKTYRSLVEENNTLKGKAEVAQESYTNLSEKVKGTLDELKKEQKDANETQAESEKRLQGYLKNKIAAEKLSRNLSKKASQKQETATRAEAAYSNFSATIEGARCEKHPACKAESAADPSLSVRYFCCPEWDTRPGVIQFISGKMHSCCGPAPASGALMLDSASVPGAALAEPPRPADRGRAPRGGPGAGLDEVPSAAPGGPPRGGLDAPRAAACLAAAAAAAALAARASRPAAGAALGEDTADYYYYHAAA